MSQTLDAGTLYTEAGCAIDCSLEIEIEINSETLEANIVGVYLRSDEPTLVYDIVEQLKQQFLALERTTNE